MAKSYVKKKKSAKIKNWICILNDKFLQDCYQINNELKSEENKVIHYLMIHNQWGYNLKSVQVEDKWREILLLMNQPTSLSKSDRDFREIFSRVKKFQQCHMVQKIRAFIIFFPVQKRIDEQEKKNRSGESLSKSLPIAR